MRHSSRHSAKHSSKRASSTDSYDYGNRGSFFFIALVLAFGLYGVYTVFSPDTTIPQGVMEAVKAEGHISETVSLKGKTVTENTAVFSEAPPYDERGVETGEKPDGRYTSIAFQKKDPALVTGKQAVKLAALVGPETVSAAPKMDTDQSLSVGPHEPPAWIKNAVPVAVPKDAKKIVIMIDDLGENRTWTKAAIALPPPMTMAYLPYPQNIKSYVEAGRKAGHEIMVHMPMEPMGGYDPEASYLLRPEMSNQDLKAVLEKNLNAFDGYVGINNHMGSRFTQNESKMALVMNRLKQDGLLFVDSRTIHTSAGEKTAAAYGVPFAERDVFIDHKPARADVEKSLARIERIADKYGLAIAIGHPKKHTIEALQGWLPTLKDKGFTVVPISAVITPQAPPGEKTAEQAPDIIETRNEKGDSTAPGPTPSIDGQASPVLQ